MQRGNPWCRTLNREWTQSPKPPSGCTVLVGSNDRKIDPRESKTRPILAQVGDTVQLVGEELVKEIETPLTQVERWQVADVGDSVVVVKGSGAWMPDGSRARDMKIGTLGKIASIQQNADIVSCQDIISVRYQENSQGDPYYAHYLRNDIHNYLHIIDGEKVNSTAQPIPEPEIPVPCDVRVFEVYLSEKHGFVRNVLGETYTECDLPHVRTYSKNLGGSEERNWKLLIQIHVHPDWAVNKHTISRKVFYYLLTPGNGACRIGGKDDCDFWRTPDTLDKVAALSEKAANTASYYQTVGSGDEQSMISDQT